MLSTRTRHSLFDHPNHPFPCVVRSYLLNYLFFNLSLSLCPILVLWGYHMIVPSKFIPRVLFPWVCSASVFWILFPHFCIQYLNFTQKVFRSNSKSHSVFPVTTVSHSFCYLRATFMQCLWVIIRRLLSTNMREQLLLTFSSFLCFIEYLGKVHILVAV